MLLGDTGIVQKQDRNTSNTLPTIAPILGEESGVQNPDIITDEKKTQIPSLWKSGISWGNPNTPLPEERGVFRFHPPSLRGKHPNFPLALSVLLGVVMGMFLVPTLLHPVTSSITVPQQVNAAAITVGKLTFLSSGQLNPTSSTGSNDILSLDLSGIGVPRVGMRYYAWLEADKTQDETPPILLGRLFIVGGSVYLTYQEPLHRDLLVNYSRVVVTEQAANKPTDLPLLDMHTWRYQAAIADIPTPGDETGYSLLSHLRHLLAQDPTLQELGLQGGLDIWLYRNSGKILEWSNAARDDWSSRDVRDLRNNVTRILDYLDGSSYAFRDLPTGTPFLADQHAGRPGLIDYTTPQEEQGPPSYISHVRLHLTGMINAPGHTAEQEQLAAHIDDMLTQIEQQFKAIRSDARKLAQYNDVQLKQPMALSLLNDMLNHANDADIGTSNPTSGITQYGVVWVHAQLQSLAVVPVTGVKADGP